MFDNSIQMMLVIQVLLISIPSLATSTNWSKARQLQVTRANSPTVLIILDLLPLGKEPKETILDRTLLLNLYVAFLGVDHPQSSKKAGWHQPRAKLVISRKQEHDLHQTPNLHRLNFSTLIALVYTWSISLSRGPRSFSLKKDWRWCWWFRPSWSPPHPWPTE